MATKSVIPKSKAKTAFGVLGTIARLVDLEPRRMRMGLWGGRRGNAAWIEVKQRPACNTVGCIGGWTNVLYPKQTAHIVLGLSDEQIDELFYGDLCMDDNQGTRRHARRVIALIRRFQKKYRAQLLAKKV